MEITFENFDKFQRKPLADRLTKAISTFYPFTDGAYVLSLNAKFGSGKTTFLKMWQQDLITQGHTVIYLNAWETDFDEDPIIPLTACLLENIKTGEGVVKAKNALKGVLGATALVGNKFLEQATGIDIYATIKETEKDLKESDLKDIGEELYKTYGYKLNAYRQLKETLTKYVEGLQKKPLVILVDELDRVRPDYSVKFLEAIKHIFSVSGICFVLAVDREQLECSVKQLYGNLDFENYYRRFITRETTLITQIDVDISGYIQQLGNEYFNEKMSQGINFCFKPQTKNKVLEQVRAISKTCDLTPRQIQYLFRVLVHLLAVEAPNKAIRENWVDAATFLIAVMIRNPDFYTKIGTGKVKANELNTYLAGLTYSRKDNSSKRYILFSALAFNLRTGDEDNDTQTAEIITKYDNTTVIEANKATIYKEKLSMLAKSINDWGDLYEDSPFQQIYKLLEDWKPFLE